MDILETIGYKDQSAEYTDRPTVKVIVKKNDKILILNNGLLPGGGVEQNETNREALHREIREEVGITIKDIEDIGTVVQYRTLIGKRYIISGYTATLYTEGHATDPQDKREAEFIVQWLTLNEALELVEKSITIADHASKNDKTNQGKLYNLMTTRALLLALHSKQRELSLE